MTFIKALRGILPAGALLTNEPLAKYTSFRIGGAADILAKPTTAEQVENICRLCRENNWQLTILGEGSNVLVADEGVRGAVMLMSGLDKIDVDVSALEAGMPPLGYITAGAGVKLAKLANTACNAGLRGLEFAQAIPGSVGGAIYMNAGAYDHDIAGACESVKILRENEIIEIRGVDMDFGYRTSRVQREGGIIIEAVFRLLPGDTDTIRAVIQDLNNRRRQKQPHQPSAGSAFKRPAGHFAGKLIQDAGCKGLQIGGAQVSEKHAGFIINTGDATAEDVCRLMAEVRRRVHEISGVWLEAEVELLGRSYPWM